MQILTSHGHALDTGAERLGELRDANTILNNADGLRRRMEEDGYLLLRGYLDREVVQNARQELLRKLASVGEIDTSHPLEEAIATSASNWTPEFVKDLRTGAAIRALCQQGRII